MDILNKPIRRANQPVRITITNKGRRMLEEYKKNKGDQKPVIYSGGAK